MLAHILIIEDNEMSLALAEHLLRQSGYITTSATDGESGVRIALENQAHLILCDLDLPGIDGSQIVTTLRAHTHWHKVPILAFTAASVSDECQRALTANFDGCIPKPIDPTSFLAAVSRYLAPDLRASHG